MENSAAIFYPKLSFYVLFYLLSVHLFAAVCLIATLDGALLCLFLFILCMVGVFYACHYCGFFSARRVDALQYISARRWCLCMVDGASHEVILAGNSIVMRYLMILHFVEPQTRQKHVLLLFPDSLPQAQLKMIRRYVRIGVM